ncbi:DUF294 nucleotidyltransferase-like domain-containing protein [Gordonia sp. (in: high G+C Gram-positive bacteria)]|uniref:DUF294 nucleotidyltransferase-like domain-containing protein n=1 Tax=Gordonia sp. (in: high G+C Gram-positive bacteria) TaxID=84139 RepID=UPI0039E28402
MTDSVREAAVAAIAAATGPDAFVEAVDAACAAVPAHRIDASAAADWWSGIVRASVAGAARLIGPPTGVDWQWFVTGSCGRREGLPGADVETLVVFAGDEAHGPQVRTAAAHVHDLLERAGLPPDGNGAIASRARCCRTAEQWSAVIDEWAQHPEIDRGVVMAGLTLDASAVDEGGGPDVDLAAEMRAAAAAHPQLARAMAQDCSAVREAVPARLSVLTRRADSVDVKRAILDPIVRLARLRAVLDGAGVQSTHGRLSVAGAALPQIDWAALARAHVEGTSIRWSLRRDGWPDRRLSSDLVPLRDLAPHDRARVRSAGREVLGAQRVLRYVALEETR